MHASLRIGKFWTHITQCYERATCAHCNDPIESLDHIITTCPSPERTTIWGLTQDIWPATLGEWRVPNLGIVLGCGSITPSQPTNDNPTPQAIAKARITRILLSESAYLIWSLRCERVIAGRIHTTDSIRSRWLNKLNTRPLIDRQRASSSHRLDLRRQIYHTWTPLLANKPDLPPNWVTDPEVLVGVTLPRPSA